MWTTPSASSVVGDLDRAEQGPAVTAGQNKALPASAGFVPGIVRHSAAPIGTVPVWGAAAGHPQGQSSL